MKRIKLTTEQHKRILENLFFKKRTIEDIAINLLANKYNDINDRDAIINELKVIFLENRDQYKPRKPQKNKGLNDKFKLSWIDKDEPLLTEEELFQMPLPEAWKLPYMK